MKSNLIHQSKMKREFIRYAFSPWPISQLYKYFQVRFSGEIVSTHFFQFKKKQFFMNFSGKKSVQPKKSNETTTTWSFFSLSGGNTVGIHPSVRHSLTILQLMFMFMIFHSFESTTLKYFQTSLNNSDEKLFSSKKWKLTMHTIHIAQSIFRVFFLFCFLWYN